MPDVSVIVSLKADSEDRLRNLRLVADCYTRIAEGAEMIVVEQGMVPAVAGLPGVRHVFVGDDGCHWKTRNLNMDALLSGCPLLVFTDCAALPHPEALIHGLVRLRDGADAVHLFDGVMTNVPAQRAETAPTRDAFFAGLRPFPPDRIDPLRRDVEVYGIARASGRSFVQVLRLSRDAEGQFVQLTSTFDRLLDGASPLDLFAPAAPRVARLRT